MGRKGLTKFFDLSIAYIDPKTRYNDGQLSATEFCIKNHILAGALKAIREGHRVEVLKTLKANGENAQISFNGDLRLWVISSKNVAILARTEADI